jgi:hypothetical protein
MSWRGRGRGLRVLRSANKCNLDFRNNAPITPSHHLHLRRGIANRSSPLLPRASRLRLSPAVAADPNNSISASGEATRTSSITYTLHCRRHARITPLPCPRTPRMTSTTLFPGSLMFGWEGERGRWNPRHRHVSGRVRVKG